MLEMEADLPLSNNQLYAELKKEMKGEGGVAASGDGDAARLKWACCKECVTKGEVCIVSENKIKKQ